MYRSRKTLSLITLAAAVLLVQPLASASDFETEYEIGPRDVLSIRILDTNEGEVKVTVSPEGTIVYPMIGRVRAAGLAVSQLEKELARQLANGYFANPNVLVTVTEYNSKHIVVMGEVEKPGVYPVVRDLSLVDLLAMVRGTGKSSDRTLVVVRQVKPGTRDAADGRVVKRLAVDLKHLTAVGEWASLTVQHGDIVIFPRKEDRSFFAMGQINKPGRHPVVGKEMTVRQAITLAGDLTRMGSERKIHIIRMVDGEEVQTRAKMEDIVLPGDVLSVGEGWF